MRASKLIALLQELEGDPVVCIGAFLDPVTGSVVINQRRGHIHRDLIHIHTATATMEPDRD